MGLACKETNTLETYSYITKNGKLTYFKTLFFLGNPGVTHFVPTTFIDECSGYGMGHAWVTDDDHYYAGSAHYNCHKYVSWN